MRSFYKLCFALLFAATTSLARAEDCSAPKSRGDIKTLITNLGYQVTEAGNLLKITINNKYNYPVYFSPMADKDKLVIFTVLETVPEDKYGRMPAIAILKFNDSHLNYLSLNKQDGDLRFVLQTIMYSASATPLILRTTITQLIDDANASETLWSPGKWN